MEEVGLCFRAFLIPLALSWLTLSQCLLILTILKIMPSRPISISLTDTFGALLIGVFFSAAWVKFITVKSTITDNLLRMISRKPLRSDVYPNALLSTKLPKWQLHSQTRGMFQDRYYDLLVGSLSKGLIGLDAAVRHRDTSVWLLSYSYCSEFLRPCTPCLSYTHSTSTSSPIIQTLQRYLGWFGQVWYVIKALHI